MHDGSERLHELADSVQHGAVFNEQTAQEVGQGLMGAYLDELANKRIEKTARLISKRSRSREMLKAKPSKSLVPVDVLQVLQEGSSPPPPRRSLQEGSSPPRRSSGPRCRPADLMFSLRTL
ncbi:hypothetical protein M407DRAFT_34256 [Tulasnella calospora MUT 4182]|uniref:Uncharacterized protein n=1 Tax=Tulasnella calospora MUT 4182 TaxID=1051891 RepID=A0A0C3K3V9_9AGAM|nr:hypothetical protein M407DRAFT_34256 [Tulasnella calospora MUT 4182]